MSAAQPLLPSGRRGSGGQSLAETALFLPLIIFLIAGVLEVSNLLVTQNRVAAAARAGTRFAAANFGAEHWADWEKYAAEAANVTLNNVTETLDLDPARWDIWVIEATVSVDATSGERSFATGAWNAVHVGDEDEATDFTVVTEEEWLAGEPQIQQEILDALETVPDGTRLVATDAYHHRHAFLGLLPYDLGALTRIRGFTVMRVDEVGGAYGACDAFPIAISLNSYALHPVDAVAIPTGHERYPFDPEADPADYAGDSFHWPQRPANAGPDEVIAFPPPGYAGPDLHRSAFPHNVPGRFIEQAQKGDIFLARQVADDQPGAFRWLRWNEGDPNGTFALLTSLEWPGNSQSYYHPYGDFLEPGYINRFDLVKANTAARNAAHVREPLRSHVDRGVTGRLLRLIVFTPPGPSSYDGDANDDGSATGGTGEDRDLEVYAFVLGRIVAWRLTNAEGAFNPENWLVFEFHSWDIACAPNPAPATP